MNDQQPKALRLADELRALNFGGTCNLAAAELHRLHTENQNLRAEMEAIGAGGVGPLKRWSPPPSAEAVIQMARDAVVLGNIESPFNACMHQEHCKRWKEKAEQQQGPESVPAGWKLVPVDPGLMTQAALLAAREWPECDAPLPRGRELWAAGFIYRAMLAAAPKPPVVEQPPVERAQQVAARKDAVFEVSIDFIGTLTGMRPLTDEQKRDIARYYVISPEMVAAIYRDCNEAIERAHGIGGGE